MFAVIFLTVVVALITFIYFWAVKRKNYWKDRNVPHVESPLLIGSLWKTLLMKEVVTDAFDKIYNHPKAKDQSFVGINVFHKPSIFVRDPELIKKILVKDFNYFTNRHTRAPINVDPISALNLFQAANPLWKNLRVKLSPIFTSGKMKQMFYMVEKIGEIMNQELRKKIKNDPIVEMRGLMSGFTIDSIAIVAFATEANCLQDDQMSEFKQVVINSISSSYLNKLAVTSLFFFQELQKLMKLTTFSPEYNSFITKLFKDVMTAREKGGAVRNDLIDALLALKKAEATNKDSIFSDDVLLAQAAVFLFAGYETSSSTLGFMSYFLAKHPDVQERAREELREALTKSGGVINYELVTNDLPYLTRVMKETLRLYPILPLIDREVVLPDGQSGYPMEPYSNVRLPKGTPVFVPIYSLHRDPQYFPDPEKFDPDRFEDEKSIPEYAYLPFGTGPHNCIGERFALMQIRIALANLMRSFKLETCDKTPDKIVLDPEGVLLRPKGGILIRCVEDELKY